MEASCAKISKRTLNDISLVVESGKALLFLLGMYELRKGGVLRKSLTTFGTYTDTCKYIRTWARSKAAARDVSKVTNDVQYHVCPATY